jgi:hypothetical protein
MPSDLTDTLNVAFVRCPRCGEAIPLNSPHICKENQPEAAIPRFYRIT